MVPRLTAARCLVCSKPFGSLSWPPVYESRWVSTICTLQTTSKWFHPFKVAHNLTDSLPFVARGAKPMFFVTSQQQPFGRVISTLVLSLHALYPGGRLLSQPTLERDGMDDV